MRALIFVVIIAILLIIAALATGFLKISQTRVGKAPEVRASNSGVTAKGGQSPAFDVETGSVRVGAKDTQVKVPTLVVEKPNSAQNGAAANNAM